MYGYKLLELQIYPPNHDDIISIIYENVKKIVNAVILIYYGCIKQSND